jgi:hypothetical protein
LGKLGKREVEVEKAVRVVGKRVVRVEVGLASVNLTTSSLPSPTRASLSTIEAKMAADGWHQLLLFSMGSDTTPEATDWPPAPGCTSNPLPPHG